MEPLTTDFWLNEAALLHGLVYEIVEEAAERGVIAAVNGVLQALLNVREPQVDYGLLNEAAHALAQQHAFDLVTGVTETSRRAMQREFTDWIASGEPLPALIDKLTPMFGPVRAEAIAVTEVTRVYHRSNVAAWREFDIESWVFQTAVDEIVCPICEPSHGKEYRLDDEENAPPRHTRCRCYSKPLVRLPNG
jgi:SPP1 gp7 family putative phage head morphogenesis protein